MSQLMLPSGVPAARSCRSATPEPTLPVRSTIPGVSDQPPCLDWLEQLSRLDWNGEIVLFSQTEEKVPVPAVLLLAASQVVQATMKSVPSLLLDSASPNRMDPCKIR